MSDTSNVVPITVKKVLEFPTDRVVYKVRRAHGIALRGWWSEYGRKVIVREYSGYRCPQQGISMADPNSDYQPA
jgi:hypothetical protein